MFAKQSLVVIEKNLTDVDILPGDVGTVVAVYEDGKAYEVEFVDGKGSTVELVTLDANDIRSIRAGELLHTRQR